MSDKLITENVDEYVFQRAKLTLKDTIYLLDPKELKEILKHHPEIAKVEILTWQEVVGMFEERFEDQTNGASK